MGQEILCHLTLLCIERVMTVDTSLHQEMVVSSTFSHRILDQYLLVTFFESSLKSGLMNSTFAKINLSPNC